MLSRSADRCKGLYRDVMDACPGWGSTMLSMRMDAHA